MGAAWLELVPGEPVVDAASRILTVRLKDMARAVRALAAEPAPTHQASHELSQQATHQAALVHRVRVAARKAGVCLAAFRTYCKPGPWRSVRGRVRAIRRLAGAVRDADVHARVLVALLDPRVAHDVAPSGTRATDAARRVAREAAREALARIASERTEALALLREACVAECQRDPGHARHAPFQRRARRLRRSLAARSADAPTVGAIAATTLEALAASASAFAPDDLIDLARLHELRLCVKRLRYAIETFGTLIPESVRTHTLGMLEEAQNRLGEVNDVAVLVDRLARYANDDATGALAGLCDRLLRVRDVRHAKAALWWREREASLDLERLRTWAASNTREREPGAPPLIMTMVRSRVAAAMPRGPSRRDPLVAGRVSLVGAPVVRGPHTAEGSMHTPVADAPALSATGGTLPSQPAVPPPVAPAASMPAPTHPPNPPQSAALNSGMPDAFAGPSTQRSLFLSGERVAAIDVGSNSVRLLAVELVDELTWRVLEEERAMTRLAHGLDATGVLAPEAMAASLEALVRFKATCDRLGVRVVRAFATAAVREATNGADFRGLVQDRTGLALEIVSDRDEGRLVHRSVARAFDLSQGLCAVADIGGGSLEVVVSDAGVIVANDSMPLGAVRLTEAFGGAEACVGDRFVDMRRHAQRIIERRVRAHQTPPALLIGCGGTFTTLMAMAAASRGVLIDRNSPALASMAPVSRAHIKELIDRLRQMPLAQRLRAPGLPSDRADIIVAGFTVVERLMKHLGAQHVHVHPGGVRDGLILRVIEDTLAARATPRTGTGMSTSEEGRLASEALAQGVRVFARKCRYPRAHCEQVARLAGLLFDQLARDSALVPDLGSDPRERDILVAAAILHDVGILVEYERHHKHSRVMILHADLPGFTPREIDLISQVARYHRRAEPTPKHAPFAVLSPSDQALVTRLAAILRVADGLDRTHAQHAAGLHIRFGPRSLTIEVEPAPHRDGFGRAAGAPGQVHAEARGATVAASGVASDDPPPGLPSVDALGADLLAAADKAALLERVTGVRVRLTTVT